MNDPEDYNRIVYIDLDGVLINWRGGFEKISGGISSDDYELKYGKISSMELVKKYGVNWWATLEWLPGGKELWNYVKDNFLNVKILTASGRPGKASSMAKKGKRIWMNKNLPEVNLNDIIIVGSAKEKSNYSNPGDILIDDTPSNINDWTNKGGIGVLHENPEKTMRELGEYI